MPFAGQNGRVLLIQRIEHAATRLTETSIEPILLSQRLTTGGDTISMRRARPDQLRSCRRCAETCGREIMPIAANRLVTTSLVVFTALAAMQAKAADVEATSTVDAVTVYPDGASVKIGRAHV